MGSLMLRCPKCGATEKLSIGDISRELEVSGIVRVGFIHRGHIFLVNVDAHMFVRGAYIMSYGGAGSGMLLLFRNYRVLGGFIVGVKTEFILLIDNEKLFDIRACPSSSAMLYEVLDGIIGFLNQFGGTKLPRFAGIYGRRYNVIKCEDTIVFSPCSDTDTKFKSDWLRLVGETLGMFEPLDIHVLSKVVSYIDGNIDRTPRPEDRKTIEGFCTENKK